MGSAGFHHLLSCRELLLCWTVNVLAQQKLPGDLGCRSEWVQRFCRLLRYSKTAPTVEIGAFWACSVMDNNLEMTSEIKLFTSPCLGCCSAMLYPANHSYSKGKFNVS